MRTNPFAPHVPCHRVLAADGSLGGFKGVWERGGARVRGEGLRTRDEKVRLLLGEGVVFDDGGCARGVCFGGFFDVGG